MPYERQVNLIPNAYLPFGQDAYERGRHYVHLWQTEGKWRFRIYRYGKPKTELVKRAKKILADMQAPLAALGQTGASVQDWALWVEKVIQNKYNYTWAEFYFSEHRSTSLSTGPLWADVDPLDLIDMRIYDRAEQEYKNAQEYERRIVAEDWIDNFTKASQIGEVENAFYSAIKNAPVGFQALCKHCYKYSPIAEDETTTKCIHCGQEIDATGITKRKKTLTYDSIKDYLSKISSLRSLKAQLAEEYWIAILGNGTKQYASEEALLNDVTKDIDSLGVQVIADQAREMLQEMPSLSSLKEAASEKFNEMNEEGKEEELALAANLENYRKTVDIIKSIDSKGLNKEAGYLKEILNRSFGVPNVN